jgi:ADP-ribose pyrophosphatase YjhB (NUDIX family)
MIEPREINHHIQKHIVSVLLYSEYARFRDLRPPKTDTNLFSYHLQSLLKSQFVTKSDKGYGLTQAGLAYVDRVSTEKMVVRNQPKIISMLLVQNGDGDVLLQRRNKQPYINMWTLPYGKLHIDDPTITAAAQREAKEKLGIDDQPLAHVGDAYIRVHAGPQILSTTLAHVFRFNRDDITLGDNLQWVQPHKLNSFCLAPAVEQIVARTFFKDDYFFEEYDEDWVND